MFGDNPLRKAQHEENGQTLVVHSIFDTIQGEGPFAGRPATFVRLWGCHLACTFCDTDFESIADAWALPALVERVLSNRAASLVVLTGGEPLRQNIAPLTRVLHDHDKHVQIETAGSFFYHGIMADFIVSPKTAVVNHTLASVARAWKYIISASAELAADDGLPITNTQDLAGRQRRLARPPRGILDLAPHRVYVQPMDEYDPEKNAANLARCKELSLRHGYALSLQQHKILGVP